MPDRYYRDSEPDPGEWLDHGIERTCRECGGPVVVDRTGPYEVSVRCERCQERARALKRWDLRLQAKADLQRQRNAK